MNEIPQDDEKFAEQSGDELRRAEGQLSSQVLLRLQAARREAVAQSVTLMNASQVQGFDWLRWSGAGAVATTVMFVWVFAVNSPIETLPQMDAMELAAAQESELLEELEFVAWMVAMEDQDEPSNSG